ncbi:MAG: cell division protein FtsZ [Candidatus Micrarchaeota archaeon]
MFEDIIASAKSNGSVQQEARAASSDESLFSNDKIRIAVIGVGGAGCNTVDRMMKNGIKSAQTIAINTDNLHLRSIQAHKKILLGANVTKGLGAGGFPEVAQKCAEASRAQLREQIGENELVFLAAGMGGGTGTGASSIVAEVAKEQGAIVISIVTIPFALERARIKKAEWGLKQLAAVSDTVAVIDNNRLVSYAPNLPITEAFNLADAITGKAVLGIADTIMLPSLLNIDYADVKSIMEKGGISLISLGEGRGTDRVDQVVKNTLDHPLLDVSYEGAKGALLHICGGNSLSLGDSISIGEKLTSSFDPNANVKIGARLVPDMGDTVSVTAIVTGLKSGQVMGMLVGERGDERAPNSPRPPSMMENIVEI